VDRDRIAHVGQLGCHRSGSIRTGTAGSHRGGRCMYDEGEIMWSRLGGLCAVNTNRRNKLRVST